MGKRKFLGIPIALAAVLCLALVPSASADREGSDSQGVAGSPATSQAEAKPAAAAGPGPDCLGFSANSPQTRVVTDDFARLNSNNFWTTLPCGTTTVTVPRGRSALVVAHVDAEVSCQGPAGQWCQGRVLIGGVEGEPNEPEPDSFAWATARSSLDQWEANAFTRTRPVTCPTSSPSASCVFTVVTQVRNHAAGMTMRLDGRTLHVQANF